MLTKALRSCLFSAGNTRVLSSFMIMSLMSPGSGRIGFERMNKKELQMTRMYVVNTSDKSKTTALLLCIFLGFFGAHQFYVGKIGKGLLYLFTAGIFGIGWIVDIFRILTGGFRDNVGAPLRK